MPEITAQQEAEYKRALEALNAMWADPEHGINVKRAYKKLNPTAHIPDIDDPQLAIQPVKGEVDEVKGQVSALTERLDKMLLDRNNESEERKLTGSIDQAVTKYRLTPEGRNTLLEQMRERQNPDAEAVAAWMVSEIPRPAAAISGLAPARFDTAGLDEFGTDESLRQLDKNPTRWFDNTVKQMFADPEFQALGS